MKKKLLFLCSLVLALASCTNDEDVSDVDVSDEGYKVSLKLGAFRNPAATRASISELSGGNLQLVLDDNDSVGVIPSYGSSSNQKVASDSSINLPRTGSYKVYYPYDPDFTRNGGYMNLSLESQTVSATDNSWLAKNSLFCSDPVYIGNDGNLSVDNVVLTPQTALLKINTKVITCGRLTELSLENVDGTNSFAIHAKFLPDYHGSGEFEITRYYHKLRLDFANYNLRSRQNEGVIVRDTFYMAAIPTYRTGRMLLRLRYDNGDEFVTDTIESIEIQRGMCYTLNFNKIYKDCEYVDFGLPSGTLWATFNIGASSSNSYYGRSVSSVQVDSLLQTWGDWEIPTVAQWNELLSNNPKYISTFFMGVSNTCLLVNRNSISLYLPISDEFRRYGGYWVKSDNGYKELTFSKYDVEYARFSDEISSTDMRSMIIHAVRKKPNP